MREDTPSFLDQSQKSKTFVVLTWIKTQVEG